jgi:exonuclease VII small subunit
MAEMHPEAKLAQAQQRVREVVQRRLITAKRRVENTQRILDYARGMALLAESKHAAQLAEFERLMRLL